ncbi:Arabinose 5-phosphate isomerase KdsD [Candidatus Magnetaquicoccaceae bacterium FCR-1]|uniref:Arabinose 5-phosphate isomerase KdsD n=1 Tax=Candidatus Magnetaquiglobus chichijimensis TaxID=3141448 RepID=A0ABQ0C5X0_9PROT
MMLERAREVLGIEAEAILAMGNRLDAGFERAVETLHACRGRIVVTGIGKSGMIGRKIAATLASTGAPAFFLHPAEGSHGDLGMVTRQDVVMILSNSGETGEVLALLPVFRRLGVPLIALVGKPESTLARMSDVALDIGVEREACPMGLAPTSSTTAALAMGDALAVCLLEKRDFGPEQFAFLHPGGSLGRRLLVRVADQMHTGVRIPQVSEQVSVRDALIEMTAKRFGMTGVVDERGRLTGVITDGDLRRLMERDADPLNRVTGEIMTRDPKVIAAEALAVEATRLMERLKITSLFVLSEEQVPVGVIHLHDLLEAGLM